MTPPAGEAATAADAPPTRYIRWWKVPATIAAVIAISAIQVWLEFSWLGLTAFDHVTDVLTKLMTAHLIGGAIAAALFTAMHLVRGSRPAALGYSERYLIGLGYGLATSLLIAIAAGQLFGESVAQGVQYAGVLMTVSLVSMELPVAGIVGGLTWHLLTRVQGPPPMRERRSWEDE